MDTLNLPILSASPITVSLPERLRPAEIQARPAVGSQSITPLSTNAPSIKLQDSSDKITITVDPLSLSTYFKPKNHSQNLFSNLEQKSPLSHNFANQLKEDFSSNRLTGLGARFSELLSEESKSYKQDIRQYSYFSSKPNASEIDFSQFEDNKKDKIQSFSLELRTDSGAVIKFSLKTFEGHGKNPDTVIGEGDVAALLEEGQRAGFRSTEIEFEVDGDLNQREREQLVAFGKNLEKFSADIFEQDEPNIKALDLASFDTINKATIKADGVSTSVGGISLEYRDNENQRFISVSFQGNKAEISIDKKDQFSFSSDGKAEALKQYLKILSDGANEAKAGQMQAYMMQEVFSAGFKVNEEEQTEADLKAKQRDEKVRIELNGNPPKTGEVSNDVFIPLADFDFSFESRKDRPNSAKKPLEYSGFDLNLSLNSQQTMKDDQTLTQQTQNFKVKGAFYEPLPHLLKADFEYQNYRHTTFEREASKTVTTLVEDGQLLSATMEESGQSKSNTSTYSEGKLIDESSEQDSYSEITDLTGLFFTEGDVNKSHNQLDILDKVMINPFEDRD